MLARTGPACLLADPARVDGGRVDGSTVVRSPVDLRGDWREDPERSGSSLA
jgi:hypothetical protein